MAAVSGHNGEEGLYLSFARDRARLFLCRASKEGNRLIPLSLRRGKRRGWRGGTNVIFFAQADGGRLSRRRSCRPAARKIVCA